MVVDVVLFCIFCIVGNKFCVVGVREMVWLICLNNMSESDCFNVVICWLMVGCVVFNVLVVVENDFVFVVVRKVLRWF